MKKRLAVFLSVLIVAFAAIGVGLYFYFGSTKSVFTKAVTKSINELLDGNSNILKGIDYNTLSINTRTDVNVVLDKDKYSAFINGDVHYNKTTNKIISDLSLLANNEKIVSFTAVLDNSKLYVKLKDLMKNFYYLDVPLDSSVTTSEKDIKYVRELVQKSFFNELKEEDFAKDNEKITLDREVNVKKITLKLDAKRINTILKKILENIKKDKKAMSIIQKISKDLTEDSIDKAIKEIDEEIAKLSSNDYILYTIYVSDKDNIVRHEISMSDSENQVINDYKLIINIYDNNAGFKTKELLLNIKKNTFLKISSVENSKTTSTLTITSDVISGHGSITKNDSEENISLNLNMQGMDIGTISFSIKKVSNKEYSLIFNVDAKLLTYSAKITSENKILLNEKITDVDVKNANDYKTMTEEELNTIMSSIMMNVATAFPSLMQ